MHRESYFYFYALLEPELFLFDEFVSLPRRQASVKLSTKIKNYLQFTF